VYEKLLGENFLSRRPSNGYVIKREGSTSKEGKEITEFNLSISSSPLQKIRGGNPSSRDVTT